MVDDTAPKLGMTRSANEWASWSVRLARHAFAVLALGASASSAVAQGEDREPIQPIPLTQNLDAGKVALGEELFDDTALSSDGSIACSSCHAVAAGGADTGRRVSVGFGGAKLAVNTPTVLNAGFNFRQFWDGRSDSLEAQADAAMQDKTIMNNTWPRAIEAVSRKPDLAAQFRTLYPDAVTRPNILDAIATYERSLSTPNARFDTFLRGDKSALTADEAAGWALFKSYGCVSCHQGVNIGGNMFQVLGVVGATGSYFTNRGDVTGADLGRFNVTGEEGDKYVFKVPSLRNVALTAPYLHDGSAATLPDAVRVMFKYQLGRQANPQDVAQIVKFLGSLTGENKGKPAAGAAAPPAE